MYLDKLVVHGFKSFAAPTTFTFDQPFVAIVGPNGSGKTNVADALRWVMGEQALKLIRMKRPVDAIFAGSAQRSRLGMARVDLYLNNHDGRLKLDYPEVVISRQITRDGETTYFINKTAVRLQDILLLLAQANFGQKSYGVIGQGMITDILNANPPDRKNFFDEATGVKEYQMKRDQAINKLIRTEENLLRVQDVLKEIEPRLHSLSRQVKKLERREVVADKLRSAQIHYYGSVLFTLKAKLADLGKQRQSVQANITVVTQQLHAAEGAMDTISKERSRGELYHELEQKYNDIIARRNAILKDQAVVQGRLEVEHERSGEINVLWLQRRADELQRRITTQQADRLATVAACQHRQTQLDNLLTTQATVIDDLQNLQAELEQAKIQLKKTTEVLPLPEIQQRLEQLFLEQEQFLRELLATNSLAQFKVIQKRAEDITTHFASLVDELHTDRADEVALQQQSLAALQQRLMTTVELRDKLITDSTQLQITLAGQQEKIKLYQNSIQALQQEHDYVTAEILAQQKATTPSTSTQLAELTKRQNHFTSQLAQLDGQLVNQRAALDQFNQAEETKKQRLVELQIQARQIQTQLNQLITTLQSFDLQLAKLDTRRETVLAEITRQVAADAQTEIEQWSTIRPDQDQLLIVIEQLQHQLELIGGIDPEIIAEHMATRERYDFLKRQSHDLTATLASMEKIIDELDHTIKRQFDASFKSIARNFAKYFSLLFAGGEAKLELLTALSNEDSTTQDTPPLGKTKKNQRIISGIDIIAQPPGKKLTSIHALSGGEKSMTAIALICAIIGANTPPFVVLDEVEAALDETNSEKFSAIIRQLSSKTQFVVITHNRATMQQADVLFGVTMNQDSTSHILSVKLAEAEHLITNAERPSAAASHKR